MRLSLHNFADAIPPGPWAVGVSGGADSVAMLSLLRGREDLSLHVVHLDHQTRAGESARDAEFVAELAKRWNLPCTIATRDEIETQTQNLPRNRSARFRVLRLALFRSVVMAHHLQGVLLAHHRDDQAETILLRLLRGAGPTGLAGMAPRAVVGKLVVVRPLLDVPRQALRDYLRAQHLDWREDVSNVSDEYLRNRLRKLLAIEPAISDALLELGTSSQALAQWIAQQAPSLEKRFESSALHDVPPLLAREAARRWLLRHGAPAAELSPAVLDRLIEIAQDASTPARQHFPGGLLVRRRGGDIFVD